MSNVILVVQTADGTLRELPIVSETVVIGRDQFCHIVLQSRMISRRHAQIDRQGTHYVLRDLGSRNGTRVNGALIETSRLLVDGDQIDLGSGDLITFVDGETTSARMQPARVGISLDPEHQHVWVDGTLLHPPLSPTQYRLLDVLVHRKGAICTRSALIAQIWPDVHDGVSDEALDALIKRVRARLAEVPGGEHYLVTLRGRGLMVRD